MDNFKEFGIGEFSIIMFMLYFIYYIINTKLKNNTKRQIAIVKLYNNITYFITLIYLICFFGININMIYFGVIFAVAFVIYISFKLSSIAINKDIVDKQDKGLIYVRDIDAKYSPPVVSYLVNQRIEVNKDIMATILNLCVKKALRVDKDGIHNVYKKGITKNLTEDEKYVYNCIVKKENFDKNKWYKLVIEQFNSLDFVRQKKKITDKDWICILIISVIILMVLVAIFGQEIILPALMLGIIGIIVFINTYVIKQPYMKYTKKGAIELIKWNRFKDFLKDYTLVNEAPLNKIILLEKYLSYGMALDVNKKYSMRIMNELNANLNVSILDYIKENLNNVFLSEN